MHLDAWGELIYADGYDILLKNFPSSKEEKLYFVNLGGYDPVKFTELHKNKFVVATSAAEYLLKTGISAIGIDTLSPDRPDDGFPVHQLLLSNDKYIIENVKNADKLPAVGSYIIALPIKIENATEAPVRLVGLVEK